MRRKRLFCSNSKICEFLQWWGLMIWIRKLKHAFPSNSGQVYPRLSLLGVWTCGHGCECGTHNLCGAAVAKKQWGWILLEMDMVPAPGCGLPACGREHLPAESPAWTPECEVSVAEGVQSTGSKKPHQTSKTWLRSIPGSGLLL